MQSYENVLN